MQMKKLSVVAIEKGVQLSEFYFDLMVDAVARFDLLVMSGLWDLVMVIDNVTGEILMDTEEEE